MSSTGTVAVTGATGRQGGGVARALLARGRPVRALTRSPRSAPARALAALGAQVVRADMDDPASLDAAFAGAEAVFGVQNPAVCGLDREVRQGRNVGDAARRAGVAHLVYGSAGTGERGTGIGYWESKLAVEDHLRTLGLPLTVLRPTAFMELMTDRDFVPAAGVWHVWPKLVGGSYRVPWLCCADLGEVVAAVLADPGPWAGRDLTLASELRSLDDCRRTWTAVFGRPPRRFPMPVRAMERFARDTVALWRWMPTGRIDVDPALTRTLHPGALTVEAWLRKRALSAAGGGGRGRVPTPA
jgi:uncharacterized protein YbjT (DUF2867 family)